MQEERSPNANRIVEKLSGINDKDIRFFRVEEFIRMTTRNNHLATTCPTCAAFEQGISETVAVLDQAIKHPGKERKRYDQLISQLSKHQRRDHGFFPPFYHNYLYTFYGLLAGAILGALLSLIASSVSIWFFVVPFVIVGLLAGQVIGGLKDSKIRTQKRIL